MASSRRITSGPLLDGKQQEAMRSSHMLAASCRVQHYDGSRWWV